MSVTHLSAYRVSSPASLAHALQVLSDLLLELDACLNRLAQEGGPVNGPQLPHLFPQLLGNPNRDQSQQFDLAAVYTQYIQTISLPIPTNGASTSHAVGSSTLAFEHSGIPKLFPALKLLQVPPGPSSLPRTRSQSLSGRKYQRNLLIATLLQTESILGRLNLTARQVLKPLDSIALLLKSFSETRMRDID